VRSANITPSPETGIGSWTSELFLERFKVYDSGYVETPAKDGEFNTMMPWTCYGTMEVDDLKAIYAYLRTVPPVENAVKKFSPH
jgi:hypothetical protein